MDRPTNRFTYTDGQKAIKEWKANCGPFAIAAGLGLTLEDVRPHMGDFRRKHYTNHALMLQVLHRLQINFRDRLSNAGFAWHDKALTRVQWDGPWCGKGHHFLEKTLHTHWIATVPIEKGKDHWVFDWNAMRPSTGNGCNGWLLKDDWEEIIIPRILERDEPEANGKWWTTHQIEIHGARGQAGEPAITQQQREVVTK